MSITPTTNFPTSTDSFPDPGQNTRMDATGFEHDLLHQLVNDALEAIMTKLGIDGSVDTSSIDYLLKNSSSNNPGHTHSTSAITSGTFADARISQSSVTQHQGAIDHDSLSGFVGAEHIDWTQDQGATNIDANNLPDLSGTYQTADSDLTAIAGLSSADGNFIVGSAGGWVAESGATARASLGLGTLATQNATSVSIIGGSITGITDLAIADGGTGASTANAARINLGLAIGTNVQAFDADLSAIAALGSTGFLTRTAANTYAQRTITGTSGEITVTNGNGVSGNPTISLPSRVDLGAKVLEIPHSATPTVDEAGEIAIDTSITDHTGLIKYHDGVEELVGIAVPTANLTTTGGQLLAYNATNNEFEFITPGGGGNVSTTAITDNAIARGDGGGTNIQSSGITIDDSNNISGINNTTGNDTNLVTGTAGNDGDMVKYDANGDAIASTLTETALETSWIDAPALTFSAMAYPHFQVQATGDTTSQISKGTKIKFDQTGAGSNTNSLTADGTNDYASITDASQTGLDITGDISLEAWIKIEEPTGSDMCIVSRYGTTSNHRAYQMYVDSTTSSLAVAFSSDGTFNTSGSAQVYTADITLPAEEWIHVAITFDISTETCKMYYNGDEVANTKIKGTTLGASIYNTPEDFRIGAIEGGGSVTQFFRGKIAEVRAWTDIRTETEIRENFNKNLAGTETNLVGYWKLDNNYNDTTSNSNNLTSSGSPVFNTTPPEQLTRSSFYGVVVEESVSTDTTYTIYPGRNNSIRSGETISNPKYSYAKDPVGFDSGKEDWKVLFTTAAAFIQNTPTLGTWYDTTNSIYLGLGEWEVSTNGLMRGRTSSGTFAEIQATLSDTTSSNNLPKFFAATELNGASGDVRVVLSNLPVEHIKLTSNTLLNLLVRCEFVAMTDLRVRNDIQPIRISGVCAYI